MHLDFETIDKRVWANNPEMLKNYGYEKGEKIGLADYISEYHFSEMNARMRGKLASLGWHVDDWNDNVLVYDIRTIDEVRAIADKVQEAYDAGRFIPLWKYVLLYPYYRLFWTNDRAWSSCRSAGSLWLTPKWADKLWNDELDLGGDDDVDYNGTYLDIVFDMVEIAHKHSGKLVR